MSKLSPSSEADPGDLVAGARSALGEFGVVPEARTVRIRRVLPGPIERVWAFLTESDKRAVWLASGPMDLRVGGRVELHFQHANLSPEETPPERFKAGGHRRAGRVTRCEPPHVLSYTWDETSDPSEVTFELAPQGAEVLLVLTHRRLGDRKTMLGVATGWHTHLGVLVDRLADRAPGPFWSTFLRLEAEYDRRLPPE